MKTRIRQLVNGKWLVEARKWYHVRWHGARVARVVTRGTVDAGRSYVPVVSLESAGSIHYALCWLNSEGEAKVEENEIISACGE